MNKIPISQKQLHILQHSLGVNEYGEGNQYRNRFVTGPGGDDFQICKDLVAIGLMEDFGSLEICGGMHCFVVTENGKSQMILNSPKPPRISKSRARYLRFLEADCGIKFGEWLRKGYYKL